MLLDLRLPQGRGVELLRNLRQLEGRQPSVVVFSGTIASALEVRELTSLGVSGYINEYTSVQHIVPSLTPHLFPDSVNRRSSPRAVLGIPVAYRFGNTIAAALTLNISRGGLAIRTTSPLERGTAFKLRFRLPATKIGHRLRGKSRVGGPPGRHGRDLHLALGSRPEGHQQLRPGPLLQLIAQGREH